MCILVKLKPVIVFQLSDASHETVYMLCGDLTSLDHSVLTIRSTKVILNVNPEGVDVAGMAYELDYVFSSPNGMLNIITLACHLYDFNAGVYSCIIVTA